MPSYLSYLSHIMDAKDDNIETWITVRGNHIPIMKGQSKEEAVKNFIAKKSDKESSARSNKPESAGAAAKRAVSQTKKNQETYKAATKEEERLHTEAEKIKQIKKRDDERAEQRRFTEWTGNTLTYEEAKQIAKNRGQNITEPSKEIGSLTSGSEADKIRATKQKEDEQAERKRLTDWASHVLTYEEAKQIAEARKQKSTIEPQTVEQASLWLADTLASTEGFTEANFSKEDKEMLKRIEAKFGDELAKIEEENALYEQAWQNVEEQYEIANRAPGGNGVSYTDFLSPTELEEYEKQKQADVQKEFERLKGEKETSEKFDYGPGWPKSPKFEKLTKQYMPTTGESDNELGEMLRSINRATYRYYNDGDVWNKGYGKETVNAAIKHLTELARKKDIPRHISRGLENGLYELKNAGGNKDKYETGLKLLLQTVEFAPESDINAMLKIKRNNGN